jgi:hypothetical protein
MLRLVSTVMHHSFLLPNGTRDSDEASSSHVMMEVMIYGLEGGVGNKKDPAGRSKPLPGPWI